jgi:hypothetical protein
MGTYSKFLQIQLFPAIQQGVYLSGVKLFLLNPPLPALEKQEHAWRSVFYKA